MRWCLALLGCAACFHVDPIQETTRPIKEAARAREAARLAGQYTFHECASPQQCWTYEAIITTNGDGFVNVLGDPQPLRMTAVPRVAHEKITFSFEKYTGEGVDPGDVGFRVLDPVRGRFSPGQHLVNITRDPTGAWCLNFESLESRTSVQSICAR